MFRPRGLFPAWVVVVAGAVREPSLRRVPRAGEGVVFIWGPSVGEEGWEGVDDFGGLDGGVGDWLGHGESGAPEGTLGWD